MQPTRSRASHPRAYWRGLLTLAALGALTWVEFQLSSGAIGLLLLIGVAKAGLILQVFMHISRLWKAE